MEMSEQMGELAAALAAARSGFLPILKDRKGQIGRQAYWYATLDSVIDATVPALAEQGVTVIQSPGVAGSSVTITTLVIHTSGQWLRSVCASSADTPRMSQAGNPVTSNAQEVGKTITYLRRYALTAILCVTADEDLDGSRRHAAQQSGRAKESPGERNARQSQHDPTWESDRPGFCARLGELGITYDQLAAWLEQHGRPRPSHMTADARRECMAWLTDNAERVIAERAELAAGNDNTHLETT